MERDPHGKNPSDPGAKLDDGKRRADLLLGFSRALEAVADVLTHGAAKYSPGGWRYVPDGVDRYTAAMIRHLLAEGRGEEVDADSGLLHAAQVAWNALARLELALSSKQQPQQNTPGEEAAQLIVDVLASARKYHKEVGHHAHSVRLGNKQREILKRYSSGLHWASNSDDEMVCGLSIIWVDLPSLVEACF